MLLRMRTMSSSINIVPTCRCTSANIAIEVGAGALIEHTIVQQCPIAGGVHQDVVRIHVTWTSRSMSGTCMSLCIQTPAFSLQEEMHKGSLAGSYSTFVYTAQAHRGRCCARAGRTARWRRRGPRWRWWPAGRRPPAASGSAAGSEGPASAPGAPQRPSPAPGRAAGLPWRSLCMHEQRVCHCLLRLKKLR